MSLKSKRNRTRESGQGMLEYILIVVFVVVAGIVTWRLFGDKIKKLVEGSTSAVQEQTGKVLDQYEKEKNQ